MNEEEIMKVLASIDEYLIDEKIDELLKEKGAIFDMNSIKEKSFNKMKNQERKKRRLSKKPFIAAALVATLAFTTVYAKDISKAIKSYFNKSVVYSTVVDGDAYLLPKEIKLNETFTLKNFTVSQGEIKMSMTSSEEITPDKFSSLELAIIPKNNEAVKYLSGGFGPLSEPNEYLFMFFDGEDKIVPFKDFKLMLKGESYDISLAKAENLKVDENLKLGISETGSPEDTAGIVNVAGIATEKDGLTNIQLIAAFDDPDLKLDSFGEVVSPEYEKTFENKSGGSPSMSGFKYEPILAYDNANHPYELKRPKDATYPNTIFETDAEANTPLTVKLPSLSARYEKAVAEFNLSIPKEGEVALNQELDFIIQKALIKSIKRVSEDSAVVEFELNTGRDKSVTLINLGALSQDVMKAVTTINGNKAVMTITLDKTVEEVNFHLMNPSYIIEGNWSIELGNNQ